MATREGILGLAGKTRRAVESGEVQRQELTPKGQLLFSLGVGSRQWDSLTRDEVLSLGVEMPPSLTERVTGAVGDAASATGDYLSKLPGVVTEGIPAAAQAGMEAFRQPTESFHAFRRGLASEPVFGGPPHAPTMQERIEAFSPVSVGKLLFDAAGQTLHAFGKAAAELGPEQAKPLTEAAAANLPFLGVRGPMAALASDIRGLRQAPRLLLPEAPKALPGRVGGMTPLPAERIPKTGMLPEGVSPKAVTGRVEPVKALPPPRLEMRPPHVSGVGPRPGAGRAFETAPPVAPRAPYGVVLDAEGRVISAVERPPEPGVVKARGIPAELDQVTPEGVRARVEALRPTTLPTAQETATRLDRPAPPPQTLAEQFAEAKAREGFVPKPVVRPPAPQPPKMLPPATRRPFRQGAIMAPASSTPPPPSLTSAPPAGHTRLYRVELSGGRGPVFPTTPPGSTRTYIDSLSYARDVQRTSRELYPDDAPRLLFVDVPDEVARNLRTKHEFPDADLPGGVGAEFQVPSDILAGARELTEPPYLPPDTPPGTTPAVLPPKPPVPVAPGAPPPAPKAPVPSGPIGPPPKVPRPPRPKPDRVIDVGTVNLGDPDDVRILVRGFKGIRFGPEMAGEAEGVPFHLKEFKRGSGVAWDELVQEIAEAQSKRPKDVERDLLRTLNRYKALKEDKRAGRILTVDAEGQVEPPPALPAATQGVTRLPDDVPFGEGIFAAPNTEVEIAARSILERGGATSATTKSGEPVQLVHLENGRGNRRILAFGKDKNIVGDLSYETVTLDDGTMFNPDVFVAEPWRRKGIASAMYDLAERSGGLIPPTSAPAVRTAAGQAFREARERRTPPPAPKFEETSFGTQALIPGAEKRVIPPTKLKAPGRQADVEDTPLFGQEKAARQEASDKAQTSLLEEPPKKPVDPDDPFGAKDILPDERGEPGEGGFGKAGLQTRLASTGAGAALGGTQGDTPEERWRNAVIFAAAGLAAPSAFKGLRAMGERGAVGGEPPKVPPQFRREVVGRTPVPEVTPFDQMVPPEPPTSPAAKQAFRQQTQKVIQQAKAPETVPPIADEFAGMAGGNLPPRSVFTLPADIPGDPMPEASRAARFFRMTKRPFDYWNVPEEVVRGDPAGTAVVRLTYRRGEDGMRLKRELEDRARDVYRGLQAPEIEQINAVLDTPGIIPEQYPSLLPPRLAEAARRARLEIFDAGADATGLPRERRITGYFPRFRDTVRMEERKLVLNPQGEPYLERTFLGDIPQNFAKAFFHRTRTATDPPSRLGLDGVLIYQRATARHLTMQGGFHPVTKEAVPGYLNELQGLLTQPIQEGLKPYLSQFVNDFLGATSKGAPLAHQASRIARNVEFSRSIGGNLASPLVNMTGQVNTYALVRPQSWVRGYFDMLNPQRRALAQRFIGLEELAKADLELVQQTITKLDRIEDFTGKLAHVSGTLFRASEKNGNRYHAFLAGLRDAEAEGLTGRAAIEYARDINDATQFLGSGPAKPFVFRGPVGAVVGQFKQFQMRQAYFAKNLIAQDIKDWNALLHGQRRVPIEIMGRTYRDPMTGEVFTRPARIFPRTAKYLIMLSAVGGPDAVWPGLEEYLQEKGVTVPGLLPAIGVGVNQMMGYGAIEPGDLARSLLFYLPGPLLGHLQDMVSAARGIHYGRGLTELVNGDWGRELTLDERVDRALRGFLPVAGVAAARARRALKQFQTPGEERAALTILEALGLQPATGPILRRTAAGDPARTAIGLPPKRQEREFEERQRLTDLDAQANHIVKQAADLDAAGRGAEAERLLRDGERRLGLPPGTLELSKQGLKAAEQRREFTPLERRRFQMRNRFPTEVDRSRQRVPGIEPDEPPRLRRQRSR